MKELSYTEKMKLPYSVLLDPISNQAVVYNARHALIAEFASKELVEYALTHGVQTEAFSAEAHALGMPDRRPLPAWVTPDVQSRLLLIWVRKGGLTDEQWRAIPPR